MRLMTTVLLASLVSSFAFGQACSISTFAGGGFAVNLPGPSAGLYGPLAVAVDKTGDLFFIDQHDVLRLDATTGVLTLRAVTVPPVITSVDSAGA